MAENSHVVTCNDCRFAVFADYGYSNWTVEGTSFYCAKAKHPEDGFDRFYGEDKRLEFAAECDGFEKGEPVEMDCDREDEAELSPEQRVVWDMLNARDMVGGRLNGEGRRYTPRPW